MASRTSARRSLTDVRRQAIGSFSASSYSISSSSIAISSTDFCGCNMDVILRAEASVRTRWLSFRFLVAVCGAFEPLRSDASAVAGTEGIICFMGVAKGTLGFGSNDWVMNDRLVSTLLKLSRIESHMTAIISSSFRKWTSRLVGCTFTSTRWGSISRLR